MHIAIYARKSTENEDRQVQSLEDQIRELKALAAREGIRVGEVFQEAKSAKVPNNRPEFERLTKLIQDGEIGGVLTWSINRLSRNPIDGGLIAYLLQTGRLGFIRTIERTYRPDDNALLMSIENGMATAYIQDLSRNVARGMKGKAERGWHVCKAPVGYLNDAETREIAADPERFHLVRKVWDTMLQEGCSVAEAHRQAVKLGLTVRSRNKKTNPISKAKVYEILRDRFYTGEIKYKGEALQGKHAPMVSKEEFDRVQSMLGRKNKPHAPLKRRFALSGTMRCSACGCLVVGEKRTKHYPKTGRTAVYTYYHCTGSRGCTKKGIREEALMDQILPVIESASLEKPVVEMLKEMLSQSMENGLCDEALNISCLKSEETKLNARQEQLTAMRLDCEISSAEFAEQRGRIMQRLGEIRERASRAQSMSGRLLEHIYGKLDAARKMGEYDLKERDPAIAGMILREAGEHSLNLERFEFRLDPALEKIAAFEPARNSSGKLKNGDHIAPDSVWWRLADELRTTATDQIARNDRIDAIRKTQPGYRRWYDPDMRAKRMLRACKRSRDDSSYSDWIGA